MAARRSRLRVASPPGTIGVMVRLGCDTGAIRSGDRKSQGRESRSRTMTIWQCSAGTVRSGERGGRPHRSFRRSG